VDDSKLARMSAGKTLDALHPDWVRVEAANADEAAALAGSVDLVLLDFNMPGRNGLEFAAELRAAHPAMPVAIISANHQLEVVNRAAEVGASFLPKPLTAQALGPFLDEAVHRLKSASR
jgi:DNA-binding NarL/FixJ family response regulator